MYGSLGVEIAGLCLTQVDMMLPTGRLPESHHHGASWVIQTFNHYQKIIFQQIHPTPSQFQTVELGFHEEAQFHCILPFLVFMMENCVRARDGSFCFLWRRRGPAMHTNYLGDGDKAGIAISFSSNAD